MIENTYAVDPEMDVGYGFRASCQRKPRPLLEASGQLLSLINSDHLEYLPTSLISRGQLLKKLWIVEVRDDEVEIGRGRVGNGRKPRPFVKVDVCLRKNTVAVTTLRQPKMCGRR